MGGLLAFQSHFAGLGRELPRERFLAWKPTWEDLLASDRCPMCGTSSERLSVLKTYSVGLAIGNFWGPRREVKRNN